MAARRGVGMARRRLGGRGPQRVRVAEPPA
jgi:hypothetical protein